LRELAAKSVSLDVYIWLAYRLHTLQKPTPVRWQALYAQFGSGYDRMRAFRDRFAGALAAAVVAYPEAHVEMGEDGLILHPSRPPVAPKLIAVGRH